MPSPAPTLALRVAALRAAAEPSPSAPGGHLAAGEATSPPIELRVRATVPVRRRRHRFLLSPVRHANVARRPSLEKERERRIVRASSLHGILEDEQISSWTRADEPATAIVPGPRPVAAMDFMKVLDQTVREI